MTMFIWYSYLEFRHICGWPNGRQFQSFAFIWNRKLPECIVSRSTFTQIWMVFCIEWNRQHNNNLCLPVSGNDGCLPKNLIIIIWSKSNNSNTKNEQKRLTKFEWKVLPRWKMKLLLFWSWTAGGWHVWLIYVFCCQSGETTFWTKKKKTTNDTHAVQRQSCHH